jgi:rfaE bifunctional protein nucleotidyltransferase chain/domain
MIIEPDDLVSLREDWRASGETVVWTNGCFDILHIGHIRFLRQARDLGTRLVVGLNDDDSVRALKGPGRPTFPSDERAEMLDALSVVDAVTVFSERVPLQIVARVRPDVFCKGGDYRGKAVPEADIVRSYGGRVELLDFTASRSTTDVINRTTSACDR